MANTFELIASSTVGSGGQSSISFTSIPSTYTDLQLVVSARTTYAGASNSDYLYITINSDTTSANYPTKMLLGNGSAANSYGNSTQRFAGDANSSTSTANTFGNGAIYIPNYAGSAYKSLSIDAVSEANATAVESGIVAMTWNSTSAITSISLASGNSGNIVQYSTAYLYGVKNA